MRTMHSSDEICGLWPFRVVLGLLAACGFLLFGREPLSSDALHYYTMSISLLETGTSRFYWPLGWPMAMAAVQAIFGASQLIAKLFSLALVVLTLEIQLRTVRRSLTGQCHQRHLWLLAYGCVALNGLYLLYHGTMTYSVVPMAFLGSLLVYAILFMRSPLLSGVLIALMTTVRFGSIALLPFVLFYQYRVRRNTITALMATAALSMAIIAVPIVWVSVSLGQRVLLNTANDLNLFYGNHPNAPLYETWPMGHTRRSRRTRCHRGSDGEIFPR